MLQKRQYRGGTGDDVSRYDRLIISLDANQNVEPVSKLHRKGIWHHLIRLLCFSRHFCLTFPLVDNPHPSTREKLVGS